MYRYTVIVNDQEIFHTDDWREAMRVRRDNLMLRPCKAEIRVNDTASEATP